MDFDIHRAFEQASLILTFPGVAIGLLVVYLWGPAAWAAFRRPVKTHQDYLVMGVTVGFIFGPLDSIFWFIPWSLNYVGSAMFTDWVKLGVYFNVPFRQGGDIVSAWMHVYSYSLLLRSTGAVDVSLPVLRRVAMWSSVAGIACIQILNLIAK